MQDKCQINYYLSIKKVETGYEIYSLYANDHWKLDSGKLRRVPCTVDCVPEKIKSVKRNFCKMAITYRIKHRRLPLILKLCKLPPVMYWRGNFPDNQHHNTSQHNCSY